MRKRKVLSISLSPDLYSELERLSKNMGMPKSRLIENALKIYFDMLKRGSQKPISVFEIEKRLNRIVIEFTKRIADLERRLERLERIKR